MKASPSGETVAAFANQAAVAIENARLYDQAQQEIAERKRVEEELKNKAQNLEEVNTALNILIKNMESKESDIQEQVIANIKHLVLPYLTKIRNNTADSNRKSLLDIVESNLNKITANGGGPQRLDHLRGELSYSQKLKINQASGCLGERMG